MHARPKPSTHASDPRFKRRNRTSNRPPSARQVQMVDSRRETEDQSTWDGSNASTSPTATAIRRSTSRTAIAVVSPAVMEPYATETAWPTSRWSPNSLKPAATCEVYDQVDR